MIKAKDLMNIINELLKHKEDIKEGINEIRTLIKKIKSKKTSEREKVEGLVQLLGEEFFGKNIKDWCSVLSTLIEIIIRAVTVAKKGILITSFFAPDTIIYFPYYEESWEFGWMIPSGGDSRWFIARNQNKSKQYVYYEIQGENSPKNVINELKDILDKAFESGNEARFFRKKFKEKMEPLNYTIKEVDMLWCFKGSNPKLGDAFGKELPRSKKSWDIRKEIQKELLDILSSPSW